MVDFGRKESFGSPGNLSNDDPSPLEEVGIVLFRAATRASGFKSYRYIKIDIGSGNIAAGQPVSALAGDLTGQVGTTVGDATTRDRPLGVGIGVITAGNYGWVQVGGPASVNVGGNTGAAGATVVMDTAATPSICNTVAAGTAPGYTPLGVAQAVQANNKISTLLAIPYWGA